MERLVRLVPTIFLVGVSSAVLFVTARTAPEERVELRYQAGASDDAPRQIWERFEVPGTTSDGAEYRCVADRLILRPSQETAEEIVFQIPANLQESMRWSVESDLDHRRAIFLSERGMAVWDFENPETPRHVWRVQDEALAGETLTINHSAARPDSPESQTEQTATMIAAVNELDIQYQLSPNKQFVAVHPVRQNAKHSSSSMEGAVVIRRIDTGEDVHRLVHSERSPLVEGVNWSPNSEVLATSSILTDSQDQHLSLWNVASGQLIGKRAGAFTQCAITPDARQIVTVSESYPYVLSVLTPDASTELVRKTLPRLRSMAMSPDGRSIAVFLGQVGKGDAIEMLEVATLKPRWKSTCEGIVRMRAFHPESDELIVTWMQISEGTRCRTGVRGWDAGDGTIVLEGICGGDGAIEFTRDGSIHAGRKRFDAIPIAVTDNR